MSLAYAGKSAIEMAELLEVHPVTMSRWMNDKRDVKGMVLKLWASETGVNEKWLRTGEMPAGAIVQESCATRDSNPQPSDLWSDDLRRRLFAFGISLDLEPEELRDYLVFLDEIAPITIAHVCSSQAGLASIRNTTVHEVGMRCPGCDCEPVGYAPHNGRGDCPPKDVEIGRQER